MRADQYLPPSPEVLARRLAAADKPGEHLWVMIGTWYLDDPTKAYDPAEIKIMDRDNLLFFQGPGCFKCEKPFSKAMTKRRCLGNVDG